LIVSVVPNSEAEAVGLMAGDKITKINNDAKFATMESDKVSKALRSMPRPFSLVVERVDNLDHNEELHRAVQKEKVLAVIFFHTHAYIYSIYAFYIKRSFFFVAGWHITTDLHLHSTLN
jgi:membrane-associated protease RseP (regulator of RpoE activity)